MTGGPAVVSSDCRRPPIDWVPNAPSSPPRRRTTVVPSVTAISDHVVGVWAMSPPQDVRLQISGAHHGNSCRINQQASRRETYKIPVGHALATSTERLRDI